MNRLLAIDPSTTVLGYAEFINGILIASKSVKRPEKEHRIARSVEMLSALTQSMALANEVVCEEPKLSGRFQSKGQSTIDRLLGMIEYSAYQCGSTVNYLHPMTIKSYFGAVKTDKLDMALKAGEYLDESEQSIMADAISREAYDETDAICIGLVHLKREVKIVK